MDRAVDGRDEAVEVARLDADVVEEVLDVPQRQERAGGMRVQRRRAVRGERRAPRLAECRRFEEAGDAETARGVGLEDVDVREHLLEVQEQMLPYVDVL